MESTSKATTPPGPHDDYAWMDRNADSMRGNIDRYLSWNLSVFPLARRRRLLDFGCGPGHYFPALLPLAPRAYVGVDVNPDYVDELRARFDVGQPHEAVVADIGTPAVVERFRQYRFDVILCFDVLEHLADAAAAVRHMRDIARTTGAQHILIRVPALPFLYGANDRAIGHHRRYTRRSLRALLAGAGLSVTTIAYQNIAGVLPWLIVGRVWRRSLAASRAETRSFDRIVPLLRVVEHRLPPPFGLSVYAVCAVA